MFPPIRKHHIREQHSNVGVDLNSINMARIQYPFRVLNYSLTLNLLFSSICVRFEVDCGASVTVADIRVIKKLLTSLCHLRGASNTCLQVLGEI